MSHQVNKTSALNFFPSFLCRSQSSCIPKELVICILFFVPDRDMTNCQFVCKEWKLLIQITPRLRLEVDLHWATMIANQLYPDPARFFECHLAIVKVLSSISKRRAKEHLESLRKVNWETETIFFKYLSAIEADRQKKFIQEDSTYWDRIELSCLRMEAPLDFEAAESRLCRIKDPVCLATASISLSRFKDDFFQKAIAEIPFITGNTRDKRFAIERIGCAFIEDVVSPESTDFEGAIRSMGRFLEAVEPGGTDPSLLNEMKWRWIELLAKKDLYKAIHIARSQGFLYKLLWRDKLFENDLNHYESLSCDFSSPYEAVLIKIIRKSKDFAQAERCASAIKSDEYSILAQLEMASRFRLNVAETLSKAEPQFERRKNSEFPVCDFDIRYCFLFTKLMTDPEELKQFKSYLAGSQYYDESRYDGYLTVIDVELALGFFENAQRTAVEFEKYLITHHNTYRPGHAYKVYWKKLATANPQQTRSMVGLITDPMSKFHVILKTVKNNLPI